MWHLSATALPSDSPCTTSPDISRPYAFHRLVTPGLGAPQQRPHARTTSLSGNSLHQDTSRADALRRARLERIVSDNDRVLLDAILAERREQLAPEMGESEFFELYLVQQLLFDRDLSWDELLAGITGGSDDGGIDAAYAFFNGQLLSSDTRHDKSPAAAYELHIFQAKRSTGFEETAVDKLGSSLRKLLDLSQSVEPAVGYNQELIAIFSRFRTHYLRSATKFPTLSISVYYGTRGIDVHPKVLHRSEGIVESLQGLFSNSSATFSFVTPRDIVTQGYRQQPAALELRLTEAITTTLGGFVGLASLRDYFAFISDEQGRLRTTLLESNVRDYEGRTSVNAAIASTLRDNRDDDFWWLNNGVTIVSTRAAQFGKTISLEYPQIVNGLQSTQEIHQYMAQAPLDVVDTRFILVRIVVPPTELTRDRIIRATNSQSVLPGVALRSTEKIHRDIEAYFLSNNLYYERRRNRYQNEGKPLARIVTIPYLAEGVAAVVLRRPHLGSPRLGGRFLKNDEVYSQIFDPDRPLAAFLKAAQLCRRVEIRLRQLSQQPGSRRLASLRYLFPTAMAVALERDTSRTLSSLDVSSIADHDIDRVLARVQELDPTGEGRGASTQGEQQLAWTLIVEVVGTDIAERHFRDARLPEGWGASRVRGPMRPTGEIRDMVGDSLQLLRVSSGIVDMPVMSGVERQWVHRYLDAIAPEVHHRSEGERPERFIRLKLNQPDAQVAPADQVE